MIMNHWKNDTCVGKYLKTMYENRVDREHGEYRNNDGNHNAAQSYGGQFLWDAIGFRGQTYFNDGWFCWTASSN